MRKSHALTAVIAAVSLLFVLTGCFRIDIQFPEITTVPGSSGITVPSVPGTSENIAGNTTSAPAVENTTATNVTVPSTQAPAASVTPDVSSTQAPAAVNPLSMNNEQLINYFNTALNKIKTSKAGFTKGKLTKILDLQLSNSTANSLVSVVKNALLSETTDTTVVKKGEASDAVMSPSGSAFVSNLTAADVLSVKAEAAGGGYKITVAVKGETNPAKSGSICSKIFDFMTVDDVVNTYAPKVGATVKREDIEVVFKDCTATATIDAAGNVTSYETFVKGTMNMYNATVKKVITINTDVSIVLGSTTTYSGFAY